MADDDETLSDNMEERILADVRGEVEAALARLPSSAVGSSAPESRTSAASSSGPADPGKLP